MISFDPMNADARLLRSAFGCFPSGVTAVCGSIDGRPIGMAASSFTSVSVDPPLVSVCFQAGSTTWQRLRERPRLGISVLAEHQNDLCMALAGRSEDRFAGIAWDGTSGGGVFVQDSAAWLECSVYGEMPAGDHTIALLEIHGFRVFPDAPPLVFHGSRFRRLAHTVFT